MYFEALKEAETTAINPRQHNKVHHRIYSLAVS